MWSSTASTIWRGSPCRHGERTARTGRDPWLRRVNFTAVLLGLRKRGSPFFLTVGTALFGFPGWLVFDQGAVRAVAPTRIPGLFTVLVLREE